MRTQVCLALAIGIVAVGAQSAPRLRAQAPAAGPAGPAFEVASVKPNKSGDGKMMFGMQPGGRFTAINVALRLLIRNAYQLQPFQVVGGPGWVDAERFDIVAKAEGNPLPSPPGGPPGPIQLMLRALLADRFKLVVHNETRELPVYELVLARSDGKPGPQLRASDIDCAAMAAGRGRGAPPPAFNPAERPVCGMRMGPGQMSGGGFPLAQLAATLSQSVQRVVLDRTGLSGNFDLDLTWTPDQMPPAGQLPPGMPPPPADGPSIFTALQEQLGLKLESAKGPVEVLVIDSVEPPTPD